VRADSGFFQQQLLEFLHARNLSYIVVAKMTYYLRRRCVGIKEWEAVDENYAVAELTHQIQGWPKALRFVVVRERVRENKETAGCKLIEVPGYTFRLWVTNRLEGPMEIWRAYNGRACVEQRIEELKAELGRAFPSLNVFVYGLDLRDEQATDQFLAWLAENNLRVNFLINNAGHGDYGDFSSGDWERFDSMIALNVTALTRLTHRLLPTLKSFETSSILNVSSIAGFMPMPQLAVYAATKAYVTSFSEALRIELRNTGVSVTTLCPGPVSTEFGDVAQRDASSDRVTAPGFFKVPVEQVAGEALDAVMRDQARVIPGWKVFLGVALLSLVPMAILRFGLAQWNQSREEK